MKEKNELKEGALYEIDYIQLARNNVSALFMVVPFIATLLYHFVKCGIGNNSISTIDFYLAMFTSIPFVAWFYFFYKEGVKKIKEISVTNEGISCRHGAYLLPMSTVSNYLWEDVASINLEAEDKYLVLDVKNDPWLKNLDLSNVKLTKYSGDSFLYRMAGNRSISCEEYIKLVWLVSRDTAFSKYVRSLSSFLSVRKIAESYYANLVCRLNPELNKVQEDLLTNAGYLYAENVEVEDDVAGVADAARLITCSLKDKSPFVDFLFKVAIVDDGIKNDEWYLILRIVEAMGFNANWKSLFIRRYSPLRTEFDYKERTSNSTYQQTANGVQSYYSVLGLSADANLGQLQEAYHRLAKEHHPDLQKNATRKEDCEALLAKINEAYDVLSGVIRN